jgi:hypothetical protein
MDIDRELVIGREGADLAIDDPEMSRRHVTLRPVDAGVEVKDLGSLNGTVVNGERIDGVLTLSSSGTLKLGRSELRIEVNLPELTRAAETPTIQRAAPDETVQRERVAVSAAAPVDATVVRAPAQPPAPAPVAASPPAAPASPEVAPPAAAPREPSARPARAGGGRATTIALAVAGLFVAAVVGLLALANVGSSSSEHELNATLRAGTVNRSRSDLLLAGVQSGSPTGNGAVTVDLSFRSGNALALTAPAKFSGRLVHRFDDGAMTSIVTGTATPGADGSVSYTGTGRFAGGTGSFDEATGTYRLDGTVGAQGDGTFRLTGRVEY